MNFRVFTFFLFFSINCYEFVKLFSLMNYLGIYLFNNIEILIKKMRFRIMMIISKNLLIIDII